MTAARPSQAAERGRIAYAPRLLPAPQAAAYLGVSESKLRTLAIPRKVLDGKRLYDRLALDAYVDALATEGEPADEDEAKWEARFGGAGR